MQFKDLKKLADIEKGAKNNYPNIEKIIFINNNKIVTP